MHLSEDGAGVGGRWNAGQQKECCWVECPSDGHGHMLIDPISGWDVYYMRLGQG